MSKETDFYLIRSEAVSSLIKLIETSDDLGRDVIDELNEVIWEAQESYGVKRDDIKQLI